MGQFDTETDAALTQLNFEALSETPGGEFVEIIGDLLKLVGGSGPLGITGGVSNLLLKVRKLAGASYASNLVFVIKAVRNDLADLYQRDEKSRQRIDSLPTEPKFAEAISALALRAMQTSVRDRLKRLARIVVNGVKENDLDPENLDDMMRAAVELKEADVGVLTKIFKQQERIIVKYGGTNGPKWGNEVEKSWLAAVSKRDVPEGSAKLHNLDWKSSLSRLAALGFIISVPSKSSAHKPYGLLLQGYSFIQRLKEID